MICYLDSLGLHALLDLLRARLMASQDRNPTRES
jgi:hypothetical protein